MNILKISESLNKAYRRNPIRKDDMLKFHKALRVYFTSVKGCGQEKNKETYLRDFLRETFYGSNDINKPNDSDIDWAVRFEGQDSPVGIIIEDKTQRNKQEMITTDDLNHKAMHQLIYYYLEERVGRSNVDVRHLIANNMFEFFIFDGQLFEKYFYQNKKLVKDYINFKSGVSNIKGTDNFYDYIGENYVKEIQDEIPFTYFDLQKYASAISQEHPSDKELAQLAQLYRIFSNVHLLKLPFQNDNNSLNTGFYVELLHILGLEEVKDKDTNKTIIRRIPAGKACTASLIELTISQIRKKLYKISDRTNYGQTEEEQLFNLALELCITWINRVLFLKLLESQLLKYHKNDTSYRFLTIEKISDFDLLNYLFFDVLAVDYEKRKEYGIKEEFENVPYLNSSLFEETELEEKLVNINALMQTEELTILNQSILRKSGGINPKRKQLPTLEYLFAFLNSYNFASEGDDEEIRDNPKSIISASVLGLIFEKINGHKDGAVFTPGYVTMYMAHEAVRRTIIQKFNDTYKDWHCKSQVDLWNKIDSISIQEANAVFNTIKICDPAVGSGHFLVSALNELICAKYDLGILADKEGRIVKKKNYKVEIESDELIVSALEEGESELFCYHPGNDEEQRIQELLFNEKRTIIENCLFGVDLNPNSVNICRLRLWIELLKNSYYTAESNYEHLETLPNIDINIKCGNSIVSKFPLNAMMNSSASVKEYKKAVSDYKRTANKEKKYEIERIINEIKSQISSGLRTEDAEYKALTKLESRYYDLTEKFSEDLFGYTKKELRARNKEIKSLKVEIEKKRISIEEKKNNIAFKGQNPFEWRFEFPEILDNEGAFIGFDCVIGNPPYGLINKRQNKSESISVNSEVLDLFKKSDKFKPAQGGMLNIFRLFVVQSVCLLKENGFFSEIFPLSFACDISAHKLRRFVLTNCSIISLEAFPERDNPQKRVFENAKMSVCILNMYNRKDPSCSFSLRINKDKHIDTSAEIGLLSYEDIERMDSQYLTIPLSDSISLELVKRVFAKANRFSEFGKCNTGEIDMTFCKDAFTKNCADMRMIRGANIDRYVVKDAMSQGETFYLNKTILNSIKDIDWELYTKPRIVMQGITGVNEKIRLKMAISENAFCANSANYCVFYGDEDIHYFLGLLNSKLLNFIFKQFSTNSNVNGYEVDNLPIIKERDNIISEKVKQLYQENDESVRYEIEKQIDKRIFQLYGLTYEDVLIVDPKTTITREDYEGSIRLPFD